MNEWIHRTINVDEWLRRARRFLRWFPAALLVIGLAVEVGILVAASRHNMNYAYAAILIGPVFFTPPPLLSALGAVIERTWPFRIMHVALMLGGGIFMAVSWFALNALAEKTGRELVLRRMHGL